MASEPKSDEKASMQSSDPEQGIEAQWVKSVPAGAAQHGESKPMYFEKSIPLREWPALVGSESSLTSLV